MKTGDKIRKRRLELHMTMEDLGRAIGVQRSAINKYEKGLVDIKSSTLSAIANALNVSVIELMETDEELSKSDDIRLLIRGLNKLTPEQVEQAKNVFRAMFAVTNPELFDEGGDDK